MTNEPSAPVASNKFSPRRALLCALPFMLMGAIAAVLALYGVVTRQLDSKAAKHLATIIVVCLGGSLMIFGWFAQKRARPAVLLKAKNPEKPWLWREDWAAGRVDNAVRRSVFFLWVSVIVFDLVCVLAVVLVLRGVRPGSGGAWLALLFPIVGAAVLAFAAITARAWRRFGRACFNMTPLPVAPGNLLSGEILIPVHLVPEHAFHLHLSCVRRTSAQRGKTLVTTERVLWQDEKWLRPTLPQITDGVTRLPIFFRLPGDLPETTLADGDGVVWRLAADAKVSGPDFNGLFEVPVLTSAHAAAVQDQADATLAHQLTLDEVRKEIRSRIRIADQAAGREFVFPAARNPGFAAAATGLWLIWMGAIILMVRSHAPPLLPLIFGALALIMSIFMLDLWLRRSRLLVTPAQLTLQTSWLTLKKEAVIPTADVATLKADIGATAVHAAYYDLKLKTRKGREYILAKNLSHKPEADWIIRQIIAAIKGT